MADSRLRGRWVRHLPVLALFGLLAAVPLLARLGPESFILSLMTRAVVLGLAALSLDLLVGAAGLVSFGHAAYLGIGAYAVAILSAEGVTGAGPQLAVAVGASALFALVTGPIALRTSGVAFIMITLAFGQMLFFGLTALSAYGGDDGVTLPGRSRVFGADPFRGDGSFYLLCVATLALAYGLGRRLLGSRFGRVLAAARENPTRAEAVGLSPGPYRLVAFVLAGAVAGVAGFLLANATGFVSPAVTAWQRSGDLIFMTVLGGLGSLGGAILGAIVFLLAEEALSGWTEHWRLVFGPLLILAVLYGRGGLAALFRFPR